MKRVTEKTIEDKAVQQEVLNVLDEEIAETEKQFVGEESEPEEGDISFDFGENIEMLESGLSEQEKEAERMELEREFIEERLKFRKQIGKFRKAEEFKEIPASYITRDPNAPDIDEKAEELGYESGEALRQAILAFERYRPGAHTRLEQIKEFFKNYSKASRENARDFQRRMIEGFAKRRKIVFPQMSGSLENMLTPISSRLGRINPKLRHKIRKYEFNMINKIFNREKTSVPFLQKYQVLTEQNKETLDLALKNRSHSEIDDLIERLGLKEEYQVVRKMLDEIHKEAKEVDLDIGYLETYWPRHISDSDGLMEYFGDQEIWPELLNAIETKAVSLGRTLTNEEAAQLINSLIRGYGGKVTLARPGSLKTRVIDEITSEINKFYSGSGDALSIYITRLTDFIESRKFFGRFAKGTEVNQGVIEDSIGAFVLDLLQKQEITLKQAEEVSEILRARFISRGPSGWWQVLKNISYIDTMGNFGSALTQIGDLTYSLYKNGYFVIPAIQGKMLTKQDLGIENIIQEFSESKDWSAEALQKVFKLTGFEWMDTFGKNTLITSSFLKYQDLAKKNDPGFKARMNDIFGDEGKQTIEDFKTGRTTENVKYLLFSDLSDVQPITLSELPVTYLRSGNGRIFYMLKTFFIRHIDFVRSETIDLMAQGKVKEGIGNFVRLLFFFMLIN